MQRVARTYLRPDNMNITIAGNRDIADGLAQFTALGQVEFFDPYRRAPQRFGASARGHDSLGCVQRLLRSHEAASAKFSKLKGVQTTGEMAAGPMTLSMEQGLLGIRCWLHSNFGRWKHHARIQV